MSITSNITALRKARGLTQEQLGALLGVSNQAVSKWESGTTYPDILLLPRIAEVLDTTLELLYGVVPETINRNERIDRFPTETHTLVKTQFYRQLLSDSTVLKELIRMEEGRAMPKGKTVGILSYTGQGAAFLSDELSVISSAHWPEDAAFFSQPEVTLGLKKLGDPNVMRILEWLYTRSFREMPENLDALAEFERGQDWFSLEFTIEEMTACGLTEEQVMDAVDKLISLHLAERETENGISRYVFSKTKGVEALVLLQGIARLIGEPFAWGCGYLFGNG